MEPNAVAPVLGTPGFGGAVAADRQRREPDPHGVAVAVPVAGREIPVDAAPDLLPLGAHADRLGHLQAPVDLHADVGAVLEDALVGADRAAENRGDEQQGRRERERQTVHGAPRSTAGAIRWLASSISKNFAARKPNSRATSSEGKPSTRLLLSRTLPL